MPVLPVAASAETENVENVLNQHKFAVGQMVDFMPGQGDTNVPRGKYKVLRLMPSETKDLQYRIKHAVDGHERVVTESRLAARQGLLG